MIRLWERRTRNEREGVREKETTTTNKTTKGKKEQKSLTPKHTPDTYARPPKKK